MDISFTKEQYENLVKLIYLGEWMINGIRTDDRIKKFEDLEQYIYSFYKDFGLEKYVEYDEKSKKFFPTNELEMESDVEGYRLDYEDEVFWDELIDRLARRDFIRQYGEKVIKKMEWKERMEKEDPFIERYDDEFQKHGIERLEIKDDQGRL
jgi:hypothetical protein